MRHFSYCHKETGIIHGATMSTTEPDENRALNMALWNAPPDHLVLKGHHDHRTRRFDFATGQVVEHTPAGPSVEQQKRIDAEAARVEIARLEAGQPRLIREVTLGRKGAIERLEELDKKIEALRTALAG